MDSVLTGLTAGVVQHIGQRDEQEDSFAVFDPTDPRRRGGGVLAVVADGMGGHSHGREASQIAVHTVLAGYAEKRLDEPVPVALLRLLQAANAAVHGLAVPGALMDQLNNPGTTLTAAVIHDDYRLSWVSVGDSRLYLYRQGRVYRITADHVFGRDLDRAAARGLVSAETARQHPEREALTSYLGVPVLTAVDCNRRQSYPLQPGDRLLLCSDGLYRGLSEAEMAAELACADAGAAAGALVARVLAKQRRYQDNATALVLACPAMRSAAPRGLRGGRLRAAADALQAGIGALLGFEPSRQAPDDPAAPGRQRRTKKI